MTNTDMVSFNLRQFSRGHCAIDSHYSSNAWHLDMQHPEPCAIPSFADQVMASEIIRVNKRIDDLLEAMQIHNRATTAVGRGDK